MKVDNHLSLDSIEDYGNLLNSDSNVFNKYTKDGSEDILLLEQLYEVLDRREKIIINGFYGIDGTK